MNTIQQKLVSDFVSRFGSKAVWQVDSLIECLAKQINSAAQSETPEITLEVSGGEVRAAHSNYNSVKINILDWDSVLARQNRQRSNKLLRYNLFKEKTKKTPHKVM